MKAIFKIEEYLPETHQILVRFARLHAPKLIDEYRAVAVDYSKLDCRDVETFTQSLMRRVGDDQIKIHEENEPIKNKAENVSGELDISSLVGRVIECKMDNYKRTILKMRRVEL